MARKTCQSIVDTNKFCSKNIIKTSTNWDFIHQLVTMTLVIFGIVTTGLALFVGIPTLVLAGITVASTIVSIVLALLKPRWKQSKQTDRFMKKCDRERILSFVEDLDFAIINDTPVQRNFDKNVKLE